MHPTGLTPRRCTSRGYAVVGLAALLSACASPRPDASGGSVVGPAASAASDPVATSSPVDRLLELSETQSIVSARAPELTRRVALMAEDLTDAELERLVPAVREGFAADRLRRDVAAFVESEAPAGMIERTVALLESGANGELARLAEGYEPPMTLDAYVRTLLEDPPSEERVRVMVEWARAQGTGDFFVILDQALAEAAHSILAELRPRAADFRPLSGDALFERLDASLEASVVTYLYRLEPVADDVVRRATAEYAGDEGAWYVETYSLAVAEAMRAAAGRAVVALREPGR